MVSTVTSVPKARSPSSFVSNSQPSRSKQPFLPDTAHCDGVELVVHCTVAFGMTLLTGLPSRP